MDTLKGIESEIYKGTIYEGGYGYTSQAIMRCRAIPINTRTLMSYLASFCGKKDCAFPSKSLMMYELTWGETKLENALKEARELNLLKVVQVRSYKKDKEGKEVLNEKGEKIPSGKFGHNEYYLTLKLEEIPILCDSNYNKKVAENKKVVKKVVKTSESIDNSQVEPNRNFYGTVEKPYTVDGGTNINSILNINKEEEEGLYQVVEFYKASTEKNVGTVTVNKLRELHNKLNKNTELMKKAIELYVLYNGRSFLYLDKIVQGFFNRDFKSIEEVNIYIASRQLTQEVIKPKKQNSRKKDNFNNYEQRKYNFNNLEAMLLGNAEVDENQLYD